MLKLRTFFLFLIVSSHLFCQNSPKFEMRGLWVATVKNIDWPSKPGLPVETQKKEAIAILNSAVSLNLNAIFLQVRPSSDAFYQSSFEPMSIYLTGLSGQAPNPFYDPLHFWIDEAHQRGLELHAWINPFRGNMSVNEPMHPTHPVVLHPDWFITYNGRHQYDPGNPACRKHIANVVGELVEKYNIDGIHLDDYFYPYPKAGETFDDNASFAMYNPLGYTNGEKNNWRRYNVDETIKLIGEAIKSRKDHVSFGISPFGVWRNKTDDIRGSDTKAGITNYDHLYADILLWLREGWIDYVAPQIYWDTNHATANFKVLAEWWSQNSYGKPVFIGHSLYRVNNDPAPWDNPAQLIEQIKISRIKSNTYGSLFFSSNHFNRDLKGLQDSLITGVYKHKALVPDVIEHPKEQLPSQPLVVKKRGQTLKWSNPNKNSTIKHYVVYAYQFSIQNPENDAANIVAITSQKQWPANREKFGGKSYYYKVSAIDIYNRETALSYPKKAHFKPLKKRFIK